VCVESSKPRKDRWALDKKGKSGKRAEDIEIVKLIHLLNSIDANLGLGNKDVWHGGGGGH